MNKRMFSGTICALLILLICTGCMDFNNAPNETAKAASESDSQTEAKLPAGKYETAEQAYMDFLDGKITVTTGEIFREDDAGYNADGLLYGEYSYSELKAAIAELEMNESTAEYAYIDFGNDGIKELALRFDNTNKSLLNWVGIIRWSGTGLELNYYYEYGYRNFSNLYTSGYLIKGGANSAGSYTTTVVGFDKNGSGTDLFTKNVYYSNNAASIVYDLQSEGSILSGKYDDIAGLSELVVHEYIKDGTVKISASNLSVDIAVRAKEEALIADLVKLGAQQITQEEMDKLTLLSPYEFDDAQWITVNPDSQAEAVISIDYFPQAPFESIGECYEYTCDNSEHSVKVVLSTDYTVCDFSVLSLKLKSISDAGEISFDSDTLYTIENFTSDKPLVLTMTFTEIIPNIGIAYTDRNSVRKVFSLNMSGKDGSLLLTRVEY